MLWTLLVSLALAADPPGTVGNKISGRIVVVEASEIEETANREFQKLTRALLDVQNDLYRAVNGEVRKFTTGADGTSVRLVDGMKVELQVTDRSTGKMSIRVNVLDAQGQPLTGAKGASLSQGTAAAVPLEFAGPGEIVIEDLSTAEQAMVQIYLGDGDVLVLWLDEDGAAAPTPAAVPAR